jgi:hypothetical protein
MIMKLVDADAHRAVSGRRNALGDLIALWFERLGAANSIVSLIKQA